jgi:hypothetical protein
MEYSPEAATEVRRLAKVNLHWDPSDVHVQRVIFLSVAPVYFAAVLGRVYRDRFSYVGV